MQDIPVRVIAADAIADVLSALPRNVDLQSTLEGVDGTISGDQTALRSAIENLIRNAVSALPKEGGRVSIHTACDAGAGCAVIKVTNSGAVPADVVDALSSGAVPRSGSHPGVGLGLISVRRVAKLHGGEFSLSSSAGEVRAVLTIPLTPATTAASSTDELGAL